MISTSIVSTKKRALASLLLNHSSLNAETRCSIRSTVQRDTMIYASQFQNFTVYSNMILMRIVILKMAVMAVQERHLAQPK